MNVLNFTGSWKWVSNMFKDNEDKQDAENGKYTLITYFYAT